MTELIAMTLLAIVSVIFNAKWMLPALGDGNWGDPLGTVIGPLFLYQFFHVIFYFGLRRLLPGRRPTSTYATSRMNYLTLAVMLVIVIGSAVQNTVGVYWSTPP
ncbi:hypothetical protein GCM10007301_06420 [Azorhizobium oxalatiphilum]|uniref:Uncharacterized protein n=1 Tax=Azorhizobium oxalatiphilum TaxID=980631 RepID=A0A917BL59_9HYPH|nr:hypothetical protein [Azorhizobium oxalatiphilum]GGF49877.1 hypothetical protein GCM10007301_06420 [Azorhizobium oxalatiphilum]